MTKRIKTGFLVFFMASAVAAVLYSSQWTSYHDFDGKCLDCHITQPSMGETMTFSKDVTRMCSGCHSSEQELSHPVDMKPSMKVPRAT